MSIESHIVLADVRKMYSSKSGDVTALDGVSLEIRRSEVFGIIGRSGAGKSTLLRTINRLETPSHGSVTVGGIDLGGLSAAGLVEMRRNIGMIFQHFNLLASKTVFENLALPLRANGSSEESIRKRAHELLRMVGLEDKRDVYPSRLSGGQKQRVGIARALMLNPEILLCDEATSALDPESTNSILDLLQRVNRELGVTVVLITHEMAVVRRICDRVAVIEGGKISEVGPVWEVFGKPKGGVTRALLESSNMRGSSNPSGEGVVLIELCYDGADGNFPSVTNISNSLGGNTYLLRAGLDIVQGRAQGHILISTDATQDRVEEFLARTENHGCAEVKSIV